MNSPLTSKLVRARLARAALLAPLIALTGQAQAQDSTAPTPNPIRFISSLDGVQSIAVNSTALETRPGTGSATVTFDPVTGDLSYDIQFTGLIAEDITLGDPAVNPDGSTPAPGTINGNSFPNPGFPFGGGLFLLHFHVGARGANGPIPIDIVAPTGPAIGVNTTDPTQIQGATAGRVTGSVNVFDLDTQSGDMVADGILLNGVPVDGRDDGIGNATCTDCGFIEAILTDNVYINIHTFNNPFGETRGQLLAATCTTKVNTVQGLRSLVAALDTRFLVRHFLSREINLIDRALADGLVRTAREHLGELSEDVVELSGGPRRNIDVFAANELACAIANVLSSTGGGE